MQSKPAWPTPPAEFYAKQALDLYIPDFDAALLDLNFPNLQAIIGDELYRIIEDLYHYTAFVKHYRFRGLECSVADHRCFQMWNAALDYQLLSYPTVTLEQGTLDPAFLNILRRAILLWMDSGTWQWNTTSTLVCSQCSNIANLLQSSDLRRYQETCPDLLSWILVVGACSSHQATSYRSFFISQLKVFTSSGFIRSEQEIENILKKFIYIDKSYTMCISLLWKDIMREIE